MAHFSTAELILAGSKASRRGWVRVSDGTERVFYHCISSGKITLERPEDFGEDNPVWADGTELCIYRGFCSRCKDFVPKCEPGPVALSADHGQVALAFLLCRPCLIWLVGSALLEVEGKSLVEQPTKAVRPASCQGTGVVETAGVDKVVERRQQLVKVTAVVAGEERRRTVRATKMKLRCISEFNMQGAGDYICWFSIEGRVDYYGETSNAKAHGWGLAEYQDGSWCLSYFYHGQQNTPEGGRSSTIQYGNGIRCVLL